MYFLGKIDTLFLSYQIIMNNSQESIALPDFAVRLVHRSDEGFINEEIELKKYISSCGLGLILYFYPKDNTQGCSVQASDFTALCDEFATLGYVVLGVSCDGVRSHQNFITKKELLIGLVSDADEKLCQHFEVIKEKMMYGKTHLGVVRSTFVFDKTGNMLASFRNVKAKEHARTLLNFLKTL